MSVWFVSVFAVLLGLLLVAAVLVAISLTPFGRSLIDAKSIRMAFCVVAVLTIADVVLVARSEPQHVDRLTLTITAIAHATWWELRYEGFATANEMHIPADVPVVVRCVADRRHIVLVGGSDVVRDSLFARQSTLVLRAARGRWKARDVSTAHRSLPLEIVAQSLDEFAKWSARQSTVARQTLAMTDGAAVFMTARCTYCHSVRGLANAEQPLAPDLTHLGSRATLAGGLLPNRAGYLAGWIVDAESLKPGCGMPRNAIEPRRLQALLAFLQQLQ